MQNYKSFIEDPSQPIPKTTAYNRRLARINPEALHVDENNGHDEDDNLLPLEVSETSRSSLQDVPDAQEVEHNDVEIGYQFYQHNAVNEMHNCSFQNNFHAEDLNVNVSTLKSLIFWLQ